MTHFDPLGSLCVWFNRKVRAVTEMAETEL